MGTGVATQLITVVATLSGVVLTLAANAYLQIRTARDARDMESLRVSSDHGKWLRDQRVKAYGDLAMVTEEVLQFLRADLPDSLDAGDASHRVAVEGDWRKLRTDLRKAYNMVVLFGAEDSRMAAQVVWRTARNAGNDFFRNHSAHGGTSAALSDLRDQIAAAATQLGTSGEDFLSACRADLQDRDPTARR
jgi:hypothetical protein